MIFLLSVFNTNQNISKFESLYHKYKKLVMYIALNELSNVDIAEDIAADVFETLARNINKIDDVESDSTKSFVCIITKSKIGEYRRKNKKYVPFEDGFDVVYNDDLLEKVLVNTVADAISQLSERYKDIIVLKYYHGFSTAEIAKIHNISKETVRKRIERARQMLLKKIDGGDNNG